ncbi:MAG: hypothetical protein M1836_004373 [Candelina mexicana]|nr:MAG: hypothetical protein M1836_004373 [Candelina mexicana]
MSKPYSVKNPIPTIRQFVEALDKDKAERDRRINEEALRSSLRRGVVLSTNGRYFDSINDNAMLEKAMITCKSALEGFARQIKWDSELCLKATNNLAIIHCELGRTDKAEPLFLKVRAGKEKILGCTSISALTATNNLAILYIRTGQLDEARKLFRRSLAGFEAAHGSSAPQTLKTELYLGHVFKDLGNLEQAEIFYQRAKKGLESASDPKDTAAHRTVCFSLADLYDDQNQHDQADRMYREACSLEELIVATEPPSRAPVPPRN